uniref:Uncharacterized protein n=1 Tax=Arundo donax TaxID=35708 RepID=A0A0A8YPJ9_ARUDO
MNIFQWNYLRCPTNSCINDGKAKLNFYQFAAVLHLNLSREKQIPSGKF